MKIKIGFVIADEMEFIPIRQICEELKGAITKLSGDEMAEFNITESGRTIQISAVRCGIGKVNAAAAAAFLISHGCQMIINSGLSGGISGVQRGEYTAGTKYIEHDFDLTPIGYKEYAKPGQEYIYSSDDYLLDIYTSIDGMIPGVMVCGDSFICSEEKRTHLKNSLQAVSCDMESAAVASVCFKAQIPFISVRRISDDAGDDAHSSYTQMNDLAERDLVDVVMTGIAKILKSDIFWTENS